MHHHHETWAIHVCLVLVSLLCGMAILQTREQARASAIPKAEFQSVTDTPSSHPSLVFHPCETMDPIKDPKDADRILSFASEKTKVPAGILFGVWIRETFGSMGGSGGRAGKCNAHEQLEIRCKRGRHCEHLDALLVMAQEHHWNLDTLQGSCGTSTMEKATGDYGGCLGPMQISTGEWVTDENGAYAHKDPLNLCWAMLHTGDRLRRSFVNRFAKERRFAIDVRQRRGLSVDEQTWDRLKENAWQGAVREYPGAPESRAAHRYLASVLRSRKYYEASEHNLANIHLQRAYLRSNKLRAVADLSGDKP